VLLSEAGACRVAEVAAVAAVGPAEAGLHSFAVLGTATGSF
jgi:hypothetical protein